MRGRKAIPPRLSGGLAVADDYARAHPQLGSLRTITLPLEVGLQSCLDGRDLIVDIGCGEGGTLAAVREQTSVRRVLGLDLSFRRARISAERGFPALVADALRLPLPDASAALVICRHVIEHVEDDADLLREIGRVLRSGGYCYLETPLRLPGAWYPHRNVAGRWVLDPTHLREYSTVGELEELLVANGLLAESVSLRPIRFPLVHFLYRVVVRRRPRSRLVRRLLDTERPAVRIPRYREIQVLARRVDASQEHVVTGPGWVKMVM